MRPALGLALLLLPGLAGAAAAETGVVTVGVANAAPSVLAGGIAAGLLWVEGTDPNGGEDLVAARFELPDGSVLAATPRAAQGEVRRFEAGAEGVQGEVRAVVRDYFGVAADRIFAAADTPLPGDLPRAGSAPAGQGDSGGLQAFGAGGRLVPDAGVPLAVLAAAGAAMALRRRGR